jgi:single-stranded-DNA-specific exonuclease
MTGVKLLSATSDSEATELAKFCNDENIKRRSIQDAVFSEAVANIERDGLDKDPVLIVSGEDWNEGVVGIVASKLMDKYKKPVFVLSEKLDKNGDDKGSARSNGDDKGSACSNAELICKGSARSFGDFPIGKAIAVTSQQGLILKGGGHNLAAGVTLLKSNLQNWKTAIFDYYNSLNLDINAQLGTLKPTAEISLDSLSELSVELYDELSSLEPYGSGNPEPIFEITNAIIADVRTMGVNKQHLKLTISDGNSSLDLLMWNYENDPVAAELVGGFDAQQGIRIPSILFTLQINEFRGNRTLQGMIKSISQK